MGNKELREIKKQMKNLHSAKETLVLCRDEYNIGLYNGIEYASAVLEDRKPCYLVPEQHTNEEAEEAHERTIMSGIKKTGRD